MIVVSDTSPLNYLLVLGEVDLLPRLFGSVVIPKAVAEELRHPQAPLEVKAFVDGPPVWLEAREASAGEPIEGIDKGEAEAIYLALQAKADLLIIDDAAGRAAARARGLRVTGVLGILERAADLGWIDLGHCLRGWCPKRPFTYRRSCWRSGSNVGVRGTAGRGERWLTLSAAYS